MIRLGKYRYLIDLNKDADLEATNAFFILEFEYDSKTYVGWTGEAERPVKKKIENLISNAFRENRWLMACNPELQKAIVESKYITVTTIKAPDLSLGLMHIYSTMYGLMDEYKSYNPYGHNMINYLNKSAAEKAIIVGYSAKWRIPGIVLKKESHNYPHRAVFQYKHLSGDTYKLVKKWESVKEYIENAKPLKVNPSAIYMCCNNQRRVAYGCVWRFDGDNEIITISPDARKRYSSN